jgi:retron-type reverse transcriptase
MKRIGKLWPKIVSHDNIVLAAQLAEANKLGKKGVIRFNEHYNENIKLVQELLISGNFHTANYITKRIFEPKERIIYILPFFPDRIVQHAIMNLVEPIWESRFYDKSFSCRKGKGIHKGLLYTMGLVCRNKYCAKNDLSKFYPSMNHSVAMDFISHKIKDNKVLDIFEDVIYSIGDETNIPIGNYMSQWIGNLYLNEMDTLIKEKLGIRDYVRYCDDFILFHNDKERLKYAMEVVDEYVHSVLKMSFSKKEIFQTKQGVDFLGYRMFPDRYILLRKSTVKRIKKRTRKLLDLLEEERLELTPSVSGQIFSTLGWLKWANTHNLYLAYEINRLEEFARIKIAHKRKEMKRLKDIWIKV